MHKERLCKAAAFIKTIDPDTFRMDVFRATGACGFVGCAIGHIAHAKVFRGLVLHGVTITYKQRSSMEAVQELFDLKRSEAHYLFGADWKTYERDSPDVTPKNIARRIKLFLADPERDSIRKLAFLDIFE